MLDPGLYCIGCSLWAQLMFSKFQTMRTLWGELWGRAFNPCPPVGQAHGIWHGLISISLIRHTTHNCGLRRLFKNAYLWQAIVDSMVLIMVWSGDPIELPKASCIQGIATRQASTCSNHTEYHHSTFIGSRHFGSIILYRSHPNLLTLKA